MIATAASPKVGGKPRYPYRSCLGYWVQTSLQNLSCKVRFLDRVLSPSEVERNPHPPPLPCWGAFNFRPREMPFVKGLRCDLRHLFFFTFFHFGIDNVSPF